MDDIDLDPQDRPIYGAAAIGKVLGFNARQTYWHLERGNLDAVVDKIGTKWTERVWTAAS
jgi:hypothetical protein